MSKLTALIIDDEEGIRNTLFDILNDEGFESIAVPTAEKGLVIVKEKPLDIIFLDLKLPGIDGIEALIKIKEIEQTVPVIMISGHGSIEQTVTAMKIGAYDFLEKPLALERIETVTKRAIENKKLLEENKLLKSNINKKWQLIGTSEKMTELKKQISIVSLSNARVLILGESGVGKELVARTLHNDSMRRYNLFIEVNCAAIPQELIESELFGHEKGAFTGASERKIGKFELANEGTLFLDEIGDMSLQTQAKVLRVIESQTFQRVGGNKDIKIDVRIIAATNKILLDEIKKCTFREDLYFRLNVIPIRVPPLRERLEDISFLIKFFIGSFSEESGIKPKEVSKGALDILYKYNWPGNIRELRNTIERLMIMTSKPVIEIEDLEFLSLTEIGSQSKDKKNYFSYKTLKEAKDAWEKDFILHKLTQNNWNISRTAEGIDVERSNFHKKIRQFNINKH